MKHSLYMGKTASSVLMFIIGNERCHTFIFKCQQLTITLKILYPTTWWHNKLVTDDEDTLSPITESWFYSQQPPDINSSPSGRRYPNWIGGVSFDTWHADTACEAWERAAVGWRCRRWRPLRTRPSPVCDRTSLASCTHSRGSHLKMHMLDWAHNTVHTAYKEPVYKQLWL